MIRWVREERLGQIIEIRAGLLDLSKPINWKRRIATNGEYGCLSDLGIHTQHVPFRLGFIPSRVYAQLSKIVKQCPDGKGGIADCETWDNALLMCDVPGEDRLIPMRLETKRMAPGCTNNLFIEIDGLKAAVCFSTTDPKAFYYTSSVGMEQAWCRLDVGYKPIFKTITGSIFEFGFSDSILQMWAAFMSELKGRTVPFGCFSPEETVISHALQTAGVTI